MSLDDQTAKYSVSQMFKEMLANVVTRVGERIGGRDR